MNNRGVWQISTGRNSPIYTQLCLTHGVVLIGPGDAGPWHPRRADEEFDGGFVRRFASELQKGDIILLRTGPSIIQAIGMVASDYTYLASFDDVSGCDLQHGRRVRWSKLPEPFEFGSRVFGAITPRVSRVQSEIVLNYVSTFLQSPPTDWQSRSLPRLPVEDADLVSPPSGLEEIVALVQDLSLLYWNKDQFGDRPMEDELVAQLVIPFLRALGWPVEKLAVKWRYIDVSVFSKLPRIPENCHYLIEAKRLGTSVESALDQAIRYVKALGVRRDVVVTDGICYRMYDSSRDFASVGYANLARLKHSSLSLFDRMQNPNKTRL